jgi:hypothetical protein
MVPAKLHTFLSSAVALCIAAGGLCSSGSHAAVDVAAQADEVVATYRKIIVLVADDGSAGPADDEHAITLGRLFYYENEERLSALRERLIADGPALPAFLERLESNGNYHDADKLAFRELLEDVAEDLPVNAAAPLQKRIADDRAALDQIQALYQKELGRVYDRL